MSRPELGPGDENPWILEGSGSAVDWTSDFWIPSEFLILAHGFFSKKVHLQFDPVEKSRRRPS
jgi:hypothetical protein